MNNQNINIFNYVYSSKFEKDKSDNEKWKEFASVCSKIGNYEPYDFIDDYFDLLNFNRKNMSVYITGQKHVGGKFVSLNLYGEREYLNYKLDEIKSTINDFGSTAFDNLGNVFENLCNEAIREILVNLKNEHIIQFDNDKTFLYADNRLTEIFYDNISIVINESILNNNQNIIINHGQYINQQGNNNTANIIKSDEELFELINEKLEAIRAELKNNNCNDKLIELEKALKEKNKNKVLSVLSDLSSIGSFVATMLIGL